MLSLETKILGGVKGPKQGPFTTVWGPSLCEKPGRAPVPAGLTVFGALLA